jgi:hypothetical protein
MDSRFLPLEKYTGLSFIWINYSKITIKLLVKNGNIYDYLELTSLPYLNLLTKNVTWKKKYFFQEWKHSLHFDIVSKPNGPQENCCCHGILLKWMCPDDT